MAELVRLTGSFGYASTPCYTRFVQAHDIATLGRAQLTTQPS